MKINRASAIRQHLFAKGYFPVAEVVNVVGVFARTMRRHLLVLVAACAIVLTHGGVQIACALGSGVTVLQTVLRLRLNPIKQWVFASCPPVAQLAMRASELSVALPCLTSRPQNAFVVRILAGDAPDWLRFDRPFYRAGPIAQNSVIYGADAQETRINSQILGRTDRATFLAEVDKFGRQLTYRVAALRPNGRATSELRLDAGWQDRLRDPGCDAMLTG